MKITIEEAQKLTGEERFMCYGALDAAGTLEIFEVLQERLDEGTRKVYDWGRAQQSPAVCMTQRGVLVDAMARDKTVAQLGQELAETIRQIQTHPVIAEVWDGTELETGFCSVARTPKLTKSGRPSKAKGADRTDPQRHKWGGEPIVCERCGTSRHKAKLFEPSSSHQVKRLLYELLKCPVQRDKDGIITAGDDALETIARKRPKFADIVALIQTTRDLGKQIGFLNGKLSPASRYHSSFNVGAAWTGRWSSSKDPFGQGGNMQNITERHRHIFKADPGMTMFYADLKTAESLLVAYMSGDEGYIEAHKGDVHTYVCRLVWPDVVPWTGDIKADKKLATSLCPPWDNVPGHDYRYQSKAVQHGSNYGLTAFGMAIMRHIPVKAAAHAQGQYFRAFPGIREWQHYTRSRIESGLPLYNPLGRVIRLFGRPWDEHTAKQGFAFGPQSGVADVLDAALWNVWSNCDNQEDQLIQCLAQIHDAVLGQFPSNRQDEAIAALKRNMTLPFEVTDIHGVTRTCVIPIEIAVGKNWGKVNTNPEKGALNPDGLVEVA